MIIRLTPIPYILIESFSHTEYRTIAAYEFKEPCFKPRDHDAEATWVRYEHFINFCNVGDIYSFSLKRCKTILVIDLTVYINKGTYGVEERHK